MHKIIAALSILDPFFVCYLTNFLSIKILCKHTLTGCHGVISAEKLHKFQVIEKT